jgi:hypothetical protein
MVRQGIPVGRRNYLDRTETPNPVAIQMGNLTWLIEARLIDDDVLTFHRITTMDTYFRRFHFCRPHKKTLAPGQK